MDLVRVGIDVSCRVCDVRIQAPNQAKQGLSIENNPKGIRRLIARLLRHRCSVQVCMESTGVYGLDLALALVNTEGIGVMVLNPKRARAFVEALGMRAKTDPIDADCLLKFCCQMDFEPWEPPPLWAFQMRALCRRMYTLTEQLVQEKNRLHAAEATDELRVIRLDLKRAIRSLEAAVRRLQASALEIVSQNPRALQDFRRLCSVPGIAERSALKILGELATMPEDLTAKQMTAFVGLDPRIHQSGSSVHPPARISKRGNVYLRAALYMPAHVATQRDPALKAFYERLVERGKTKMQAKVAVMRKLLVAIQAMRRDKAVFESTKLQAAA